MTPLFSNTPVAEHLAPPVHLFARIYSQSDEVDERTEGGDVDGEQRVVVQVTGEKEGCEVRRRLKTRENERKGQDEDRKAVERRV